MSAEQPTQTGNGTSGATARSQGAPQTRTPMRVLVDLIEYTQDYGLEIQRLDGGDRPFRLVCKGHMSKITQSFIDKVAEKGWHILSITADPKKPLEVEMFVDIVPDYTPTTQPSGGKEGGVHSDGA
jgi:hypothetical protein